MSRPRKCRKVCGLPKSNLFGPLTRSLNNLEFITMTVEEYETIRLMDLENLTQEECADRMGVARTTIQHIYYDARNKLAKSLIEGIGIKIEGGDYKICSDAEKPCDCIGCSKCRWCQHYEKPLKK